MLVIGISIVVAIIVVGIVIKNKKPSERSDGGGLPPKNENTKPQ